MEANGTLTATRAAARPAGPGAVPDRRVDRRRGPRRLRFGPSTIAGLAVLGSIAVLSLARRLADVDIWWHLKTGELIARTHALPAGDPYSFTAAGKPWVVQEWGSEVLLHVIDSLFGLRGLIVWRSAMLVLIYALVARLIIRRAGNHVGTWALIALTAYAGAVNWTERPNLFSFLLFVVTLSLLERRDRRIWWFVPIAAVWANLHAMVTLGLGLVALVAVIEWLKVWFRWDGADRAWSLRLALVAGAGVAASLVNPYDADLHRHAFRLVGIVSGIISEWASPSFHDGGPMLFLALVLLTFASMVLGSRRVDPTDAGLVAAFLFLGLYALRNLAVASIVIGIAASRYVPGALAELMARRGIRPSDRQLSARAAAGINATSIAAVVLLFALLVGSRFPRSSSLEANADPIFPVATIESLRGEQVRLFTTDVWAGLALYAAWPETRVFWDTRSDFYGMAIFDRSKEIDTPRAGWEEELRRACVTHVLITGERPLAIVMGADPDWRRVREERVKGGSAVLYVPRQPAPACGR